MPVRCELMPTGTIIVYPDAPGERKKVTIYARVSSADRKKDMESQASRLQEFAAGKWWTVASIVTEVGSGIYE